MRHLGGLVAGMRSKGAAHRRESRLLSRRLESLPSWAVFAGLTVVIAAAAALFLWPLWEELPIDDAYIHLVYAQNLSEHGDLFFNSPADAGIGTSSILWVLLLAGGNAIGLPMTFLAKALGLLSLAVVGTGAFVLLRPIAGLWQALVCAALTVLSGNLLWFALNGMETTLFLALGVLALLAYRRRSWWLVGALLGLLTLTRVEGVYLLAALFVVEGIGRRRIDRGLLQAALVWGLVCAPWSGYLLLRTGHLLPTSGVAKSFTSRIAIQLVVERSPILARLVAAPMLVYLGAWALYLLEFNLGGMTLPGPRLAVVAAGDGPAYSVSVWAMAVWAAVILPLLWAGGRRLISVSAWQRWIRDRDRQPLLLLGVWTLLHNLGYMLYLPVPGCASRYGAVNHLVLWMVLTAGLFTFARRAGRFAWLGVGLLAVFLANLTYWDGVYDANLEHMTAVRIAAARFIREEIPPAEVCAAFDIGVVRYHSRRPIVDLGGLLEPEARRWFEAGAVDRYLREQRATCLVLPGRAGSREEGWFDLATLTGLTDSDLLRMEELAVFEIAPERWLRGYLATTNYQASVVIYRLIPRPDPGAYSE